MADSQSRTYCLSYDGCAWPGRHESAGQNRDESGVSTSSPSVNTPALSRPNSTFVSAMMIPRSSARADARSNSASVSRSSSRAVSAPTSETASSRVMFSSWSPISALVDGV